MIWEELPWQESNGQADDLSNKNIGEAMLFIGLR
jgi:hypothetical protein